jgi:hypothetical protein
MTLAQWLETWPYTGQRVFFTDFAKTGGRIGLGPIGESPNLHLGYVVPDTVADSRALAWCLSDFRVVSVSGGSMWFSPKE